MSTDGDETGGALPPDEAFAALGNETRVAILQALGEADEPLPFSALRERVGTRDSGQFNYHLDKLVGHFVARTDDGYDLRRAGERVVEAVLSGTVTESPEVGPTTVDQTCQYCGSAVGVRYREERVTVYCTGCAGVYGEQVTPEEYGLLGTLYLPPAGVEGRSPSQLFRAADVWGGLATMAALSGVCPRCSAELHESVEVCSEHDPADGVCEACDRRYAVTVGYRCANCIYERSGACGVGLLTTTELLAFLTTHGINPIARCSNSAIGTVMDYEEEVRSTDPFEAAFTFTVDGDALTLIVDDDLSLIDVARAEASDRA